jgi:hypothetical protein
MAVLWSVCIAMIAGWAACTMRSDAAIVFAAGYVFGVHAEHLWDLIVPKDLFVWRLDNSGDAKKDLYGTGKRSDMG